MKKQTNGLWPYIEELITYVKAPVVFKASDQLNDIKELIRYGNALVVIISPLLIAFHFLNTGNSVSSGFIESLSIYSLAYIVLFGPILEEIGFRLMLVRSLRNTMLSCFAVVSIFVFVYFINNSKYWFLLLQAGIVIIYYVFDIRFKYVFYSSNFLFAVLHFGSYEHVSNPLLLTVVITIVSFFSFLLSFIRLKFGIIWSTGVHIFANALSLGFALLYSLR